MDSWTVQCTFSPECCRFFFLTKWCRENHLKAKELSHFQKDVQRHTALNLFLYPCLHFFLQNYFAFCESFRCVRHTQLPWKEGQMLHNCCPKNICFVLYCWRRSDWLVYWHLLKKTQLVIPRGIKITFHTYGSTHVVIWVRGNAENLAPKTPNYSVNNRGANLLQTAVPFPTRDLYGAVTHAS